MPSLELSGNSGRRWGSFSIEQISGQRGLGFFRLTFLFQGHVEPADQSAGERLVAMSADVRAAGGTLGRAVPTPHTLPIAPFQYSTQPQVVLEMELDRARLEALENARNGGDLQFDLTIYTALQHEEGYLRALSNSFGHHVNQGVWVALLEQMGYRRTMLIEVPVLDSQNAAVFSGAATLLGKAQQAMGRGDYREAVGLCRDVLEEVMRVLKDTDTIDFSDHQRDMPKADRLRLLRRAMRVFTHPARHQDDVTVRFEWNRVDAASAISMTAAILNELEAPGAR